MRLPAIKMIGRFVFYPFRPFLFNQKYENMKRLFLHLQAFGLFCPVLMMFTEDFICSIVGVLYTTVLVFGWFATDNGKRFLRRYYREILRIEKDLLNA